MHEVCSCGLPHSDICGSRLICSSPQLFAAYRVLHRLPVPRHPPCALIRLTNCFLTFTVLVAVLVRTRGLSHCHAVSPACPPVFPGRQLIRYLCDNASIDVSRRHPHLIAAVRPLLWDACVSYSSCASHSFELDTFCKIIVYAVFKVRYRRTLRSGDEGIRTPDPLLAGQVLSQLSYTPVGDI